VVNEPTREGVVTVAGAGYVGLTTAACLAHLGHRVIVVDIDAARVEGLDEGVLPVSEPGLGALVDAAASAGTLRFTTEVAEAAAGADFYFVCVPTPDDGDGNADVSMVVEAVAAAAPLLGDDSVIVVKSTVPVGTCRRLAEEVGFTDVASNPEFLQAGDAVARMLSPSRIVIGAQRTEVAERIAGLYASIDAPVHMTDLETAEFVKLASNAYLAVRLSFVNELSELAGAVGADVPGVLDGMGADPRIGRSYLDPGPGWGGSCLPKDARILVRGAEEAGTDQSVLRSALAANDRRFDRVASAVVDGLGGSLEGRHLGIWGLTFKAGTDDRRDSPSLQVVDRLLGAGATIRAHDPQVTTPPVDGLELTDTALGAAVGAEALLVLTEWEEYGRVAPVELVEALSGRLVIDTRGVLDAAALGAAGLEVLRLA